MTRNRLISLGVLFLILGFPVLLTFCLNTGKNHYQELPILGPVQINSDNDTVYHQVKPFKLVDKNGDTFKLEEALNGAPFIVHFFSTNCTDQCPEMFKYLHKVNARTRSKSDLQILSISVDGQDTPNKLQKFARAQDIQDDRWHLLTGDQKTIEELATKSFLVTANQESLQTKDSVIHSDLFVLVDKDRHIRGYYKGSNWHKVKKLMDEIVVLAANG